MGDRLTDEHEILLRQIHPNFIEGGRLASVPFRPTAKDDNKLSVDRSTLTDAAKAFDLYTRNGRSSAAVYGLSVGEFKEHDIPCFSDPVVATDEQLANPAHAIADYSKLAASNHKTLALQLRIKALARGLLHP